MVLQDDPQTPHPMNADFKLCKQLHGCFISLQMYMCRGISAQLALPQINKCETGAGEFLLSGPLSVCLLIPAAANWKTLTGSVGEFVCEYSAV